MVGRVVDTAYDVLDLALLLLLCVVAYRLFRRWGLVDPLIEAVRG